LVFTQHGFARQCERIRVRFPAPGMIAGIAQVNVALPASMRGGVTGKKVAISVNGTDATLYVAQ
jgi:hypothetical protein